MGSVAIRLRRKAVRFLQFASIPVVVFVEQDGGPHYVGQVFDAITHTAGQAVGIAAFVAFMLLFVYGTFIVTYLAFRIVMAIVNVVLHRSAMRHDYRHG